MTSPATNGVFINCPFDALYKPARNAIVLSVVAMGLEPRSALETGSVSLHRMRRISLALRGSRFSVHDLTRAFGDPADANLARLNMPFEFGMAFFHAESVEGTADEHEWLGLVPASHPRAEFISDLAGYDLESHDGTPDSVVPAVMAWLLTRVGVPPVPATVTPAVIIGLLPEFENLLAAEDLAWIGHTPWVKIVAVARDLVASRLA
jgi:hypothetical protein